MAVTQMASVALPAVFDIDALDGVRDQLALALERGGVVVDARAVERVATNGLIMLISAARTARRQDSQFSISATSAAMQAAVARLGLGAEFTPFVKE